MFPSHDLGGGSYTQLNTNSKDILIDARGNSNKIIFRTASGGNNPTTTNGWEINSSGHFMPSSDSSRDIGSNSVRVQNIYADTLYGDGSNLTGISSDLVNDTTPQLGGDLDMNSKFISSGILGVKNQGSQSELRLYCESNNAHYASIKAPAHSTFSGNLTYTLPSSYGSNAQVLTTDGSGGTSWTTPASSYTNSSVDTHLNTSSASSSQVLSWNGSDYAWVTQSGGGGGGGGISSLVADTSPQLGGS